MNETSTTYTLKWEKSVPDFGVTDTGKIINSGAVNIAFTFREQVSESLSSLNISQSKFHGTYHKTCPR